MRARWQGAGIWVAVMLGACGSESMKPEQPREDCIAVGDEDGNGLADCSDPACVSSAVCRQSHSLSGSVTGLLGSGLMVMTNGQTVSVATPVPGADAHFGFPSLLYATQFDVRVTAQPTAPAQTCAVVGGTGTGILVMNQDSVHISCATNQVAIGGAVAWLRDEHHTTAVWPRQADDLRRRARGVPGAWARDAESGGGRPGWILHGAGFGGRR
jgi:hypothetical protein